MQDWIVFSIGLVSSIVLAEAGTTCDVPGWVTTIGPWGVMYFIIDRLTSGHAKALMQMAKNVNKLAVILAKVEGVKLDETEEDTEK